MPLPVTGEVFSAQTAAMSGDLGLSTTIIPVSVNVTTTPLSRKITMATLAAFLAASGFAGQNIHAAGFTGPLTGNVTGNVTGALTGNASTATKLATARAINGVNFDGTAPITVTAAAGTLTGTTLAASVVTSSLTTVGTLTALSVSGATTFRSIAYTWPATDAPSPGYVLASDGAGNLSWAAGMVGSVPASAVTPGTFPAGAFGFTNDIEVHGANLGLGSGGDTGSTAFGVGALQAAANAATNSVAVGTDAFNALNAGSENVAVGNNCATVVVSANSLTVIGGSAMQSYTGAGGDTVVGAGAFNNFVNHNVQGFNCAFGVHAALHPTTGLRNVIMGTFAMQGSTTADINDNTAIGYGTLPIAADGMTGNIALGRSAGQYASGSYELFVNSINQPDYAHDVSNSIIYGLMDATAANQRLRFNAHVGIGGAATGTSPLNVQGLPTSSAGLASGDVWSNLGVLTIV